MKCRRASGSVSRERPQTDRRGPAPPPRSERQLDRVDEAALGTQNRPSDSVDSFPIPFSSRSPQSAPALSPTLFRLARDGRDFRASGRTHERGAAREVVVDEPVSRAHHVLSHHVFRDDRGARQGASRATAPRARSRNTPRLGSGLGSRSSPRVAPRPRRRRPRLARRRPRGDRTAEPEPDPPLPSRTLRTREGDARRRAATRAPPRARVRAARGRRHATTLSPDDGCASRSARRRRRRRGSRRRRRRRGRNPSSPPTPCPTSPR